MAYALRRKERHDYKELADGVKLPKARAKKVKDPLYEVEVLEKDEVSDV